MEYECDCHEHVGHGAENMPALQKKRRQLLLLREHMVKINTLHDKIDMVMSKVEKGNIGLLDHRDILNVQNAQHNIRLLRLNV